MTMKTALKLAVIFVLALSALLFLVADILTPISDQKTRFVVGGDNQYDLSSIDVWNHAAAEKYGPAAKTDVRRHDGVTEWEIRLNDEVVESRRLTDRRPSTAYGVFMVKRADSPAVRFPFLLDLAKPSTPPNMTLTDWIKERLGAVPDELISFGERDWRLHGCHRSSGSNAGSRIVDTLFQIDQLDTCFVEGTNARGSLLIGAAVIESGLARPFGRRICRTMSSSWLATNTNAEAQGAPAYVACLLVAAHPWPGSSALVSAQLYEVRRDGSLAFIQ